MAKRKRKKFGRKRSRMSGIGALGGFDAMGILGAAAGGVGAKFLNKVIPGTMDKKLVAGGKIVVGALLPTLVKGQGRALAQAAGNGMIAIGATELLTEMGVLSGLGIPTDDDTLAVAIEGIEDVDFTDVTDEIGADVLGESVLAGDDIPVVNGMDDIPVVNGMDNY
jgi:hypothetical protein